LKDKDRNTKKRNNAKLVRLMDRGHGRFRKAISPVPR